MSNALRCVFMGTPELAVPALKQLSALTEITCVVTQPDRPAGRGKQLRASPIKKAAAELGLNVWQPETMRGQEQASQLQDADFFIVMAYGEILRQNILDLPKIGCVNIHCSLLPRWRGASPLQAAIRAGDDETGVSIMKMVRALDAGPVYLTQSLPIKSNSTLENIHDELSLCAAQAIKQYIENFDEYQAVPQQDNLVTYCTKLTSADGHLDFTEDAESIERWIRAYTPAPGCWAKFGKERVKIKTVAVSDLHTELQPGHLVVESKRIFVGCSVGTIEILELQAPGKRLMTAKDYLNGHQIPAVLA